MAGVGTLFPNCTIACCAFQKSPLSFLLSCYFTKNIKGLIETYERIYLPLLRFFCALRFHFSYSLSARQKERQCPPLDVKITSIIKTLQQSQFIQTYYYKITLISIISYVATSSQAGLVHCQTP